MSWTTTPTDMNSLSLCLKFLYVSIPNCFSIQLHDDDKLLKSLYKHHNMMRVQARAQALASFLYSLSASPGFLRVHPLRIHPLSVPWPPRVQVQPSSISYMDNLLRSLQTHFLAPTCNTSRFPSYRHRIQLFFRFCHIHLQAHISTTWIGSHLGVPAKCCPGDVPKVGSTNANLNRNIQGISGDVEESGEGVAVFFGGFDSGQ